MLSRALSLFGLARSPRERLNARWEVASPARARLFPGADAYSADAALIPAVRKAMRERCRTQVQNDPVADGIVDTAANDLVGSGPRLQVLIDGDADADKIESVWEEWADEINLAETLRVMRRARATDGESLGVLVSNDSLTHPVKLEVKLVETEQLHDPNPAALMSPSSMTDGILLDALGHPSMYRFLRSHPGDSLRLDPLAYEDVPAKYVLHYFKRSRAGQHRGVPDIAPALIRFAHLNRFIMATLTAAEFAASNAGVVRTNAAPVDGAESLNALEELELDRNTYTVLPEGWGIEQVRPEHPATTYKEFRREVLSDIARCLQMPLNVAILNSSGFNFSSGKLDHLVYHRAVGIERQRMAALVLEPLFAMFMSEAVLVEGLLPQVGRVRGRLKHRWVWPGIGAIDPLKEAQAQQARLSAGVTTLAREFSDAGLDWRDELDQRMQEIAARKRLMVKYGLTEDDVANASGTLLQQSQPDPADAADPTQENA